MTKGGELRFHCLCEISCDDDDDLLVSSHSEGTADFPICPVLCLRRIILLLVVLIDARVYFRSVCDFI